MCVSDNKITTRHIYYQFKAKIWIICEVKIRQIIDLLTLSLLSKYDKWYIIGKLLCSTFESAIKICKFEKIEFFIAKSTFIVKMFAKTNCLKNEKLYIFEKPLTMPFQICKNFGKILNNLYYRRNSDN